MLLIMMVHIVLIKALNKVEKRYFEKTEIIFRPSQYMALSEVTDNKSRRFELPQLF
jgi:hypothetical protein